MHLARGKSNCFIGAQETTKRNEQHKGEVKMPAGPIRELGEFEINIQLHPEVTAVLKVGVITEE